MKYLNLILIISMLIFSSCKESEHEKIKKSDIIGSWIGIPQKYKHPEFSEDIVFYRNIVFQEINFNEDSIELIGEHLFRETGEYQIENGELKIKLKRDDLIVETKIQKLDVDTLRIFDSLVFYRNREITDSNFEEYELIGVEAKERLSNYSGFETYKIHYYKTSESKIKIRLGDRFLKLEEIPRFLGPGHTNTFLLVYIGKGITLRDLKRLYYRIASGYHSIVLLGTKREGLSNTHIFLDRIELWWDDLENYFSKSHTHAPPPPSFRSKKSFLMESGEEVKIIKSDDLQKIEKLKNDKRYVISIGANLSIKDYIKLKELVAKKKELNGSIFTEIE